MTSADPLIKKLVHLKRINMAIIPPHQSPLKNGLIVTTRVAHPEDAEAMIAYMLTVASETTFLSFGANEFDKTIEEEIGMIEHHRLEPNHLFLLVMLQDEIIGMLNVHASHKLRLKHVGVFGITVKKQYWGYGVGALLMKVMLSWAHQSKALRKINLKVTEHNERAIGLYQKFGFEVEGILKRDICINGQFFHTYSMGLCID